MAALQRSPLFEAIEKHDPQSTAVVHCLSGRTFRYATLLHDVSKAKQRILQATGKNESTIVGERIAFLVENGYDYVGAHTHRIQSSLQSRLPLTQMQSHCSPASPPTPLPFLLPLPSLLPS